MISKLADKLANPDYRKAFVASQINIGIPFQIRGLLRSRPGWTQQKLAQLTGMLQPRISGLMTPGKVRSNIETLRRIAEAFDCGLIIRFAPFSEMARWSEDFKPDEFSVPDFEHDTGFIEKKSIMSDSTVSIPAVVNGTNAAMRMREFAVATTAAATHKSIVSSGPIIVMRSQTAESAHV